MHLVLIVSTLLHSKIDDVIKLVYKGQMMRGPASVDAPTSLNVSLLRRLRR